VLRAVYLVRLSPSLSTINADKVDPETTCMLAEYLESVEMSEMMDRDRMYVRSRE
jgi:hypothetical protein